jgi:hypothetical protein
MEYFNIRRLYQATFGLRMGLSATEHRVLEVLARKMANKTIPGTLTVKDTCFPSLERIADESLFKDRAVRYALDTLIERGIITKSHIPGRKLHKGKKRNKYENCRYHLVPEVWDAIATPFDKGPKGEFLADAVPVLSEQESAADQEFVDALSATAPVAVATDAPKPTAASGKTTMPGAATADHLKTIGQIHDLLKDKFGTHPTYTDNNAQRIMDDCVKVCVAKAGSAEGCLDVLWQAFTDATIREKVMQSGKLGGYLKQSFEDWLTRFYSEAPQRVDDQKIRYLLSEVREGRGMGYGFRADDLPSFVAAMIDRLRDLAGEEFIISDVLENDEGRYVSVTCNSAENAPAA